MKEGRYIYCIIGEDKNKRLGLIGINNREVTLLSYRDIAAVVSNTPVINFDRLDKKELTRHVASHQKVNEQVMKNYDLIPMAFGVIAPSISEVGHILERAYLQFKTALKKVVNRVEFAVQVWLDEKKFFEELINTDLEIQKLKQEISSKGSIFGLPGKLKLGRFIQQQTEIRKRALIKDIQAFLSSFSRDSALNKLTEEAMLANFSFLIDKVREPELDRKMQELGKKYEGKLRFKYIGPMPAYSFVNINLSLGNFELVDEARRLLGLAEEAALDEIKKSYRRFAIQYHPDRNLDNPGVEEEFKKITQAYSILENYCRGCNEFMGKKENQKYSFKEEDVKKSIIVH